jgi:hypothetical protein
LDWIPTVELLEVMARTFLSKVTVCSLELSGIDDVVTSTLNDL